MRKYILMLAITFFLVSCGGDSEAVSFDNMEAEHYDADVEKEPHGQTSQPIVSDRHPIDKFFDDMAWILSPPCTMSMTHFASIGSMAWQAEVDNFFEQLMSQTQNELVREWLENERHYHSRYIFFRTEFTATFEASNMFDGDDTHLATGSIVRILFPSFLGDGHREKALELYARLERIGANPQFIFCEDYYSEILQEAFPWLWEVAFE